MIRRLTSRLGRDKKQDGQVNGASPETNGVGTKRKSAIATTKPKEDTEDQSATRQDVETIFAKFAQLIHASTRPRPTQTGGIPSISLSFSSIPGDARHVVGAACSR